MSVILNRLSRIGRCSDEELRYQLERKDGLALSRDELANQCRVLELAGRLKEHTYYEAVNGAVARPGGSYASSTAPGGE